MDRKQAEQLDGEIAVAKLPSRNRRGRVSGDPDTAKAWWETPLGLCPRRQQIYSRKGPPRTSNIYWRSCNTNKTLKGSR